MNWHESKARLKANWQVFAQAWLTRFIRLDQEEDIVHKMSLLHYMRDINDYVFRVKYLKEHSGVNGVAFCNAVLDAHPEDIRLCISLFGQQIHD